MKLLTGPTGWRWVDMFYGAVFFYKGIDTGNFVSGKLLHLKPKYLDPHLLRYVRKELKIK